VDSTHGKNAFPHPFITGKTHSLKCTNLIIIFIHFDLKKPPISRRDLGRGILGLVGLEEKWKRMKFAS
jgi:hypothetical protein